MLTHFKNCKPINIYLKKLIFLIVQYLKAGRVAFAEADRAINPGMLKNVLLPKILGKFSKNHVAQNKFYQQKKYGNYNKREKLIMVADGVCNLHF